MKHTLILSILSLVLLSAPLAAHDENIPHDHRYSDETGALETTDIYDLRFIYDVYPGFIYGIPPRQLRRLQMRLYHRPDETVERGEIYNSKTDKVKGRFYVYYRPDKTIERADTHHIRTGKILVRTHIRPDQTIERMDVYHPRTGHIVVRMHLRSDGTIERGEIYARKTGALKRRFYYHEDGTGDRAEIYNPRTGELKRILR